MNETGIVKDSLLWRLGVFSVASIIFDFFVKVRYILLFLVTLFGNIGVMRNPKFSFPQSENKN